MIKPSTSVFLILNVIGKLKKKCGTYSPCTLSKNVPVQKFDRPLCDAGTKLNENINDQQSFPFSSKQVF